jgi:polyisoprenoid-binding protein YceI
MITISHRSTRAVMIAALLIGAGGCKKQENQPAPAPSAPQPVEPAATPASTPKTTPTPAADTFVIEAPHAKPKPTDPVIVTVPVSVVSATFDPANLEGATAVLALDMAKLDSGNAKRNDHLLNGYLEVAKFATGTIEVRDVKKQGDGYAATAMVNVHGIKKEMPVTFVVVTQGADSVTVKGEHTFKRTDFGLSGGEQEGVGDDLVAKLQVTFTR